MKLNFKQPARKWEETLPLGNGSLGAMIWGGITRERLGLNEESLWSGYAHDKNNQNAFPYLEKARDLIHNEDYVQAEELIRDHMLGEYNESYLPLGDLSFQFSHDEEIDTYERVLDIENSIASVTYSTGGVNYRREYFTSYPSQGLFIKLTSDAPVMDLEISFSSQLLHKAVYSLGKIQVDGKCPEHLDPTYIKNESALIQGTKGKEFHASLELLCTDGISKAGSDSLHISNASSVILSFQAVKPANYKNGSDYDNLKKEHIDDYKSLYDKVTLYLGEEIDLPTDERLARLKEGKEDNDLYALYFQYGRYLLISSSRPGSLPANLQGIWSWELQAPWSSNWTTNINTEMNYWLAQTCNLSECLEPYFEFLKRICEEGKKTAKIHYNCRGFVHHHNADYWCNTNPVGVGYGHEKGQSLCTTWSFWPMGGAWLTSELLLHYEYNRNIDFLRNTAYPILKEAALFLVDWTYKYNDVYVTCPSTSPENRFCTKDGGTSCVSMSSAMDLEMIQDVFHNFKKTCEILKLDDELLPDIEERLLNLAPFQIGSKGQLLEWNKEFEETEPGHRHVSHLYGLFPSELFGDNKALTNACRVSLHERLKQGGGHTGWSCAWIINLFAVLEDAENAYHYLNTLLTRSSYDNLWDAHPPFQIDGNFGGTAGIANMLVQDRNGQLKILPALPKQFTQGFVKGLRIKNCKAIDIHWENNEVVNYTIYESGGNCNESLKQEKTSTK